MSLALAFSSLSTVLSGRSCVSYFIIRFSFGMPKAAIPGKKKKTNGYEFPDPLPLGEILKDVEKKEWRLGPSIGKGGFGEIYSACEAGSKTSTYPYAVKIEPHVNGPLFVERLFYIKVCTRLQLEEWKKKKGIKILGVPTLQGFGSHVNNNNKYRFVVMDRFGKDVWSLFLENKKKLITQSVFTYALQILDSLEYIHSTGYVHADIKGANLLFGFTKGTENNLFLVDFGLASKFSTDVEFKKNPKRAHDGTIEYTSRDLHQGVPTRRGDLEILGYNLLHWLSSHLPWENNLKNPEKVFEAKNDLMSSVKTKVQNFAPDIPRVIIDYLEYVSKLGHLEVPDYGKCRNMFDKALKELPKVEKSKGKSNVLKSPKKRPRGRAASKATTSEDNQAVTDKENESEEEIESPKRTKINAQNNKGKANWKTAPLCDPGTVIATAQGSRNRAKKSTTPSSPNLNNKIPITSAAPKSWRDCPTIKAGNIQIPGQYTRKTGIKSKRSKK